MMTSTTFWSWAALGIEVVGLLVAFGLRTWRQWRATGSTGFRGVSGRPLSLEWTGGALFVVALLLCLAAPVAVIGGWVGVPVRSPALGPVGLVFSLGGLAIVVAAQREMGASWRIGVDPDERTDLVRTGLFRRVRNPIFTGIIVVQLGVLFMVPTILAALGLICLVVAVQIQVRALEEPYLSRTHGAAYTAYVAQTGRFVPSLRGRVPDRPTKFAQNSRVYAISRVRGR